LYNAIISRNKEIVQLLIDKGADVNSKIDDSLGITLLNFVIIESADLPTNMPFFREPGDFIAELPMDAEADQYLAKLHAEMYGTDDLKEIADLLRKHGAKAGNELLAEESILSAASVGDNKLVEKHLADGADVNEKGNKGETPLHLAATKEVAELLIAKGAEVNEKDLDGETPLDWLIGMEFFPTFYPTEVNKNAKKVNDEITTLLRKHGGKTGDELRAKGK
jgi:serine/threonine-protein phosphatase 6 regulatory ankyrin repeat subunit B